MFKLRDYQQAAVDQTLNHVFKCFDPCVLSLATGAGKSLIVAELAKAIKDKSDKKVLCLAPSKELIEQNREKYLAYGNPASMYSASVGSKCLKNDVVFGSPISVNNNIKSFKNFAAVIIDECHGISPTIKNIIKEMKEDNPKLRVIGLTATPYRLGSGYIYNYDERNSLMDNTTDPFFTRLVCTVTAPELIAGGYLTPPTTQVGEGYDTSHIDFKNKATIEQAFEGHGRKTSEIVDQVMQMSHGRRGVMFFAATIQHAEEVLASLPSDSKLITGKTSKKERAKTIKEYKEEKFKYLVNVSVLTTGFDAPHVDCIAILRATESPGLLQQIIGRGLRLNEGKTDCLVLDYAENIERHGLEDDLFKPDIKAGGKKEAAGEYETKCPVCKNINLFTLRPNKEGFNIDDDGYFIDLSGEPVEIDGKPMPAHFGRRCQHGDITEGHLEQCGHRWEFKSCKDCGYENDIAARYCKKCKGELIDPNEKLKLEFKKIKASPSTATSDKVINWYCQKWVSRKGNESLRIDYTTSFRTFPIWYSPGRGATWGSLSMAVFGSNCPSIDAFIGAIQKGAGERPKTITSVKRGEFFTALAHNQAEEVEP